jgi:hypothetical protein
MKTLSILLCLLILAGCDINRVRDPFRQVDTMLQLKPECEKRGGTFSVREEGIKLKDLRAYCNIAGTEFAL